MNDFRTALPPITLRARDHAKLRQLSEAAASAYPLTADFLAREVERATVVADEADLGDVVTIGSKVEFRDESNKQTRAVTLVYSEDADASAGRISVLSPVGAALIGLSPGQVIAFRTPSGEERSLTVLAVSG